MEKSLVVTKTLIGQADEIAAAHEHFTTHYVVGGRMALYSLLGQMLALINAFESAIDREDLLAKVKYRLRSEFGIKTQKNSSDISVLIRYMTRADRKTTHVYARTIEAAKANGITPEQLPAFIEGAGGMERIRALASTDHTRADIKDCAENRMALTKEYLSCRSALPLASFEMAESDEDLGSAGAAYAYFIGTRTEDGRYQILSRLPATEELERLALKSLSVLACNDLEQVLVGMLNPSTCTDAIVEENSSAV